MAKKLWEVVITREQDQIVYVLAETKEEAVADGEELIDPSCWQEVDTYTSAYEVDNLPKYNEVWTGGPDGHWENSVPVEEATGPLQEESLF